MHDYQSNNIMIIKATTCCCLRVGLLRSALFMCIPHDLYLSSTRIWVHPQPTSPSLVYMSTNFFNFFVDQKQTITVFLWTRTTLGTWWFLTSFIERNLRKNIWGENGHPNIWKECAGNTGNAETKKRIEDTSLWRHFFPLLSFDTLSIILLPSR